MNGILTIFLGVAISLVFISCNAQNQSSMDLHTNELIHSTSPYLLQHAHNPVDWKEWNETTLQQAKKEDKPILVSIGYSSCHWCHVMEKESFEDTSVAQLMNDHFINIKIDREERPDVDQIYMESVHAMGLNGGWPLNVFLTPEQQPFYGGTYFPNQQWKELLKNIIQAFKNNREKINTSAAQFTEYLQQSTKDKYKLVANDYHLTLTEMEHCYSNLSEKFDKKYGGVKKSPKFPMPSVWQYLASYAVKNNNKEALKHFEFTLEQIANGGIYDHVGGGFSRYSTDEEWHVPHFEKMLYDNGQLLSLYANAFKVTKNNQFKRVIIETATWLKKEMQDVTGGFYAALDADSEGEEGKFYVWTLEEIKKIGISDWKLIADYYDVTPHGNWEEKNVLRVVKEAVTIAEKYDISLDSFYHILTQFKASAWLERSKRIRPGLDNKIISGWNGLALTGLSDAYQAVQDPFLFELANENATFIAKKLIRGEVLYRFPSQKREGFLEDYAAVIQGFIKYYETSFERKYLDLALKLTQRANQMFYDSTEMLYFFVSQNSQTLIARKKELFDNVIPSSNSMMAWNLVHLGTHFYNDEMIKKGKSILGQVTHLIKKEVEYMSNWSLLSLELSMPFAEIIIVGSEAMAFAKQINSKYMPNKIIAAAKKPNDESIFKHKSLLNDKTTLYVCYNKACKLPVTNVSDALRQIHDSK